MTRPLAQRPNVVAGLVRALCTCCRPSQTLAPHAELETTALACPQTLHTYLDRGDGLFEQDGNRLHEGTEVAQPQEPEVLSDRPQRTSEKARIRLERATFA